MDQDRTGTRTVFVSYAREDREVASWLAGELERRGIPVWIDRRIRAGSHWDQEVQRAIAEAGVMLVLLSPHSVASIAVHDEFSMALDEGDLVIPVVLEVCDVPFRLRRLQWIDLSRDRGHGLEELVQRLAEHAPTEHPVAVSVKSHSRPPRLRKRSVVALGGLLVAGLAALLFLGVGKNDVDEANASGARGVPAPAPAPASASALAGPGAVRPDVATAEELLRRFETATDSRSRFLLVKSDWAVAAGAFESARDALPAGSPERRELDAKGAFARGRFELLEGRLPDAERSLRHAVAERSAWAAPQVELSTVYARLGRFAEAHAAAQAARAAAPGWWLAQAASGAVYSAEGKFADAISVYEAALAGHDVPHLRGSLALAYHAARLHDERSRALAREALARDPDLPSALLVLAEHELEQKRAAKALEYSQRLVDLALFDVSAWLVHGDALLALRRREEAKQALARAVELFARSKQLGAPPQRLKVVELALAGGTLPPVRGAERSRPRTETGRPSPLSPRGTPKAETDIGL